MTPVGSERSPESLFAHRPVALELYERVKSMIERIGPVETRTTKSQVSFRRRGGFAYLWLPPAWTRPQPAELVLSIALDHLDASKRFKQVSHPAKAVWMHHLELRTPEELDQEIAGWLREAFHRAG
jgi:hypothetical protein